MSRPIASVPIKILFVADEPRILRSFESLFAKEYEIITAGSAKGALETLTEHSIAVVITDLQMQDASGIELLIKIRELFPHCIRGLMCDEDKVNVLHNAVQIYINKCWKIDLIKAAVKKIVLAVSRRQLLRENHINVQASSSKKGISLVNSSTCVTAKSAVLPQANSPSRPEERPSLVLIESQQKVRNCVRVVSRSLGFVTYSVSSFMQVFRTLAIRENIGTVILGMTVEQYKDIETMLSLLKQHHPLVSVIILVKRAYVDFAMRKLADNEIFRYFEYPLNKNDLKRAIRAAEKYHNMQVRIDRLNKAPHDRKRKV